MYLCEVYVSNSSLYVDRLFSYTSDFYIEPFKRILISFHNASTSGIVIKCKQIDIDSYQKEVGYKLLKII